MTAFGERLAALKKAHGLTTLMLSQRSGVPVGTLNKLLNGDTRNPTAGTLRALADTFGVTLDKLTGDPGDIPGVTRGTAPRVSEPREAVKVPLHFRRVPMLGGIAAGKPIYRDEQHDIAVCGIDTPCDFALEVHGDSMVGARIFDGDIVFIRAQPDVEDGQIAAVAIDDAATLKRVFHVVGGLSLVSENPRIPTMRIKYADHDSVRILGLAVGLQAKLN